MTKPAKWIILFILIAVILISFVLYSPRFLLYSSNFYKTDAIVLLLGPDFGARKKEVDGLTNQRSGDYLIVPAHYKIFRIIDTGMLEQFTARSEFSRKVEKNRLLFRIYENTHLEIIEAQIIMSDYNLKSAVFVSSPYHMRRIKIIVSEVFARNKGGFYFTPTRYEKAPADFWELSLADWKKVSLEYLKIFWFLIYVNFLN